MPSDVHRCPAVPKPPNSAPSTARSTSASSITTIGFLPPSSRHGDCTWRPQSSPIFEPIALDPVKPTLSTRPSSSAASRPSNVSGPEAWTRFSTPAGTPPAWNSRTIASPSAARVLGRLPDDGIAAQDRRHQVPRRHGDREVARGDDRRDTDRHPEREQLLVRHLRRHGLPVQPPALAEEEVARVDDLLHLAERLRIRLADLARDQRSKCLLVGLDQPADLRDHATARRSRHRRPFLLRGARGARGVDERRRIAEQHLGDDVVGAGRIRGGQAAAGSVAANLAADDRGDGGRGNGGGHGLHTSAAPTTLSGSRAPGWRRDRRRA